MSETTIERSTIEAVDLEEMLNPFHEDGGDDPDRKGHYVSPGDNLEFQREHGRVQNSTELISNARFHQAELIALCGHKFVPKHKPEAYPVCGRCAEIGANRLLS